MFLLNSGVGKDWAGPFFPPSLIFGSFYWSFRLSVYVTLSLYLNIYERPICIPKRESSFQSNKIIGTSTLLGGKDWAGPFFPSSKMYWSIYLYFSLLNYAALSLHLNTNVWPVQKRESSISNNTYIGTSALSGGERLGRPNLPPLQNLPIYLFSLLDYATLWMYLNNFEWPIPKWELSFLAYKFIGTSTLWGGERLGRPILSPPLLFSNLSIYLSVLRFNLLLHCIWTLMNVLF